MGNITSNRENPLLTRVRAENDQNRAKIEELAAILRAKREEIAPARGAGADGGMAHRGTFSYKLLVPEEYRTDAQLLEDYYR